MKKHQTRTRKIKALGTVPNVQHSLKGNKGVYGTLVGAKQYSMNRHAGELLHHPPTPNNKPMESKSVNKKFLPRQPMVLGTMAKIQYALKGYKKVSANFALAKTLDAARVASFTATETPKIPTTVEERFEAVSQKRLDTLREESPAPQEGSARAVRGDIEEDANRAIAAGASEAAVHKIRDIAIAAIDILVGAQRTEREHVTPLNGIKAHDIEVIPLSEEKIAAAEGSSSTPPTPATPTPSPVVPLPPPAPMPVPQPPAPTMSGGRPVPAPIAPTSPAAPMAAPAPALARTPAPAPAVTPPVVPPAPAAAPTSAETAEQERLANFATEKLDKAEDRFNEPFTLTLNGRLIATIQDVNFDESKVTLALPDGRPDEMSISALGGLLEDKGVEISGEPKLATTPAAPAPAAAPAAAAPARPTGAPAATPTAPTSERLRERLQAKEVKTMRMGIIERFIVQPLRQAGSIFKRAVTDLPQIVWNRSWYNWNNSWAERRANQIEEYNEEIKEIDDELAALKTDLVIPDVDSGDRRALNKDITQLEKRRSILDAKRIEAQAALRGRAATLRKFKERCASHIEELKERFESGIGEHRINLLTLRKQAEDLTNLVKVGEERVRGQRARLAELAAQYSSAGWFSGARSKAKRDIAKCKKEIDKSAALMAKQSKALRAVSSAIAPLERTVGHWDKTLANYIASSGEAIAGTAIEDYKKLAPGETPELSARR